MSYEIDTVEQLITGPTSEPLDLDEVKKALRFTSTSEDTLIDLWIAAARQHFEEQTGRQVMTATWELGLAATPYGSEIEIPHPPLQSIVSITVDGVAMGEDDYSVVIPSGPTGARGRIVLASGASWPTITTTTSNALRIQYRAGYGSAPGAVPELVKAALLFLVGHFHQYRSEVYEGNLTKIPLGAEAILRAFKWSALPTLLPRTTLWV